MTIQSEIQALKCADCARSDSAVSDLQPDSLLPIPSDALSGWRDGRPGTAGVTRRKLLRNGVLGFAAVYGASQLSFEDVWESAVAQAAEPMGKSIVVIYLNGGNDGLNCFVPLETTQYTQYKTLRPTIARLQGPGVGTAVGTTIMPGTNNALGFSNKLVSGTAADQNGDTQGFDTLYGDGTGGAGSDLAIIPAADYNPPNRSHFESRDYWFAGALSQLQTGWLGRWLDAYGSQSNPLQAVSLDSNLSKQIRSATAPVCALEGLQGVGFRVPGVSGDVNSEIGKLATVPAGVGNDHLARSRGMMGLTVDVANRLTSIPGAAPGPGYPPNSGLSQKLQLAATLLSAGLGTRIVTIDWGSFDTHGAQLAGQDPQLTTLSRALAAFKADLAARGVEQNVITMVFSEFGRRLEESDSAGTDHGSGGPIMLSGTAVKGGLAGEHPGVNVNQDGDLVVKTDFRTVYQSLIAEWLGGDPNAILPGGPFPAIQRADGGHTLTTAASRRRRRSGMIRRPIYLALLVLALAAAPGVAGSAGERVHRLHLPPPAAAVLPQSLAVDEFEWGMRGTHLQVAAGTLRIHVYNRGMDDHDLAVVDAHGQLHTVPLASGADAVLNVDVAAGPVKLYCSLFAGTPDSHEAKGMLFDVTAR